MNKIIKSVGVLHNLSESDLDELLIGEQRAHQYPWSKNNFLSSIQSSHIAWCLKIDNNIAASLVATKRAGEAELLMITVYPQYQRQGIATLLLGELEQYCGNSTEQIFLEVRASNKAALGFYESQDYIEVGVRSRYYPSPKGPREDAIIMAKPLLAW